MGRLTDRYSSLISYFLFSAFNFYFFSFTWNQSVFFISSIALEYIFFVHQQNCLEFSLEFEFIFFLLLSSIFALFQEPKNCQTQSNIEQLKLNPGVVNTKTVSFLQHRN